MRLFTKNILLATLATVSVITANASPLSPQDNLGLLKQKIMLYHKSGAYSYAITKIADQAQTALDVAIKTNKAAQKPQKLAMVLDIDETSLSNYSNAKKLQFGGTRKMINDAENSANDPAIKPTLRLYNFARAHGVTVFFITGRTESMRDATIKNLMATGYTSVKKSHHACQNLTVSDTCVLYLRAGKYLNTSAIPYKTAMRKKIAQAGYHIVINMGDQYSDLVGGFSQHVFKYPNYMYYIA